VAGDTVSIHEICVDAPRVRHIGPSKSTRANLRRVVGRGSPKVAAPWQKPCFGPGVRSTSKDASFTAHFHEFSLIRLFLSVSWPKG